MASMKTLLGRKLFSFCVPYFAFCVCASAQGSAFSYQGRLNDSSGPFTGNAEFQPTLWGAVSGGTAIATNSPPSVIVPVTNGLFVLPLDFGAAFPGADRWLQFEVRTTIGQFVTLAPRQRLTPTPYAITASNLTGTLPAAQLIGTVPSAQVAGTYSNPVTFSNAANTFAGNGAGLTGLDASQLTTGAIPDAALNNAWKINGNMGTSPTNGNFIGTTDNQPVELKVNGQRVVRWERQTNAPIFGFVIPNTVGGFESNRVADGVGGATIAGGGGPEWYGPTLPHTITGSFSTIGGGVGNVIDGVVSAIAGGERGTITFNAYNSFLGGGAWNTIHSPDSTIGGGRYNLIQSNSYAGFIGGGYQNTNSGSYATVPGGYQNSAAGYSFAAGTGARANHNGAFVWADSSSFGGFASTAANEFSVRANGGVRFVTGGAGMTLDGSPLARLNASQTFSGALTVFGDIALENASAGYHHLRLSGGNALGYLYSSFPAHNDGIHLAYNYYADANGAGHVFNAGGATSRLTVGYGFAGIYIGGMNAAPNTQRLLANSTGVTVNGTFNNASDRNVKQDFAPINPSQILEKVAQLPLSEWSYKDDPATRHVGPMGQDFYAAFNIGTDEKHIAPLDEGGVALAAIQGLNQKLEETRSELKHKDAEIAELRRAVAELVHLVKGTASE
jgi:hypothetical protein